MKTHEIIKMFKENRKDILKAWAQWTFAGTVLFSLVFIAPIVMTADKIQGTALVLETVKAVFYIFSITGLLCFGTMVYALAHTAWEKEKAVE
jgi:heme/copper-type cytochrome/quinol oxidase subunit 3